MLVFIRFFFFLVNHGYVGFAEFCVLGQLLLWDLLFCLMGVSGYGLLVGVDHGLKLFPGDICFFWLQWFVNVSDFTVYSNQICTAQMDRNDQNRAVSLNCCMRCQFEV
jgi:hypothetical protein